MKGNKGYKNGPMFIGELMMLNNQKWMWFDNPKSERGFLVSV